MSIFGKIFIASKHESSTRRNSRNRILTPGVGKKNFRKKKPLPPPPCETEKVFKPLPPPPENVEEENMDENERTGSEEKEESKKEENEKENVENEKKKVERVFDLDNGEEGDEGENENEGENFVLDENEENPVETPTEQPDDNVGINDSISNIISLEYKNEFSTQKENIVENKENENLEPSERDLSMSPKTEEGESKEKVKDETKRDERPEIPVKSQTKRNRPKIILVQEPSTITKKFKRKLENIKLTFACPITNETFKNPVILSETGNTYEESAIREWLKDHDTDPLTNSKIKSKMLVPNIALKNAIQEWKST